MGLLKESKDKRPIAYPVTIVRWPKENEGLGFSVSDGWHFGIGFGLALTVALPLILSAFGCLLYVAVAILGVSLGSL